ncbi:MAG: hypothetical protein WCH01_10540, partial [Methylococcaceae bacterium]
MNLPSKIIVIPSIHRKFFNRRIEESEVNFSRKDLNFNQFFHGVNLRTNTKIIRNDAVFSVAALNEEGFFYIFTFSLCPNNEYKCLAVCIIRIPSTVLFSALGLLYLLFGISPANSDWHGELSFRSDYVYRGYSKSQGNPVAQGLIDCQGDSGWFGEHAKPGEAAKQPFSVFH